MSELDAQLAEMTELPRLEDESLGYEWDEFRAYYDPKARIFYWHSDSGCSCNYWGDSLYTLGDFENGDRAALLAAVDRWRDSTYCTNDATSQQFTRFLDAVRAVK